MFVPSLRARLTLLYLALTSAGLLLFGVLSFASLRFALLEVKRASIERREQRLLTFLAQNAGQPPSDFSEQLRNFATLTHEGNLFQLRSPGGGLIFPADP